MDQRKATVENGPLLSRCSAPRTSGQQERGQYKKTLSTGNQPQIPAMNSTWRMKQ